MLNSDIILKYKRLQGFEAPYIPGWDTHGLPIEMKVAEELGEKIKEMSKNYGKENDKEFLNNENVKKYIKQGIESEKAIDFLVKNAKIK